MAKVKEEVLQSEGRETRVSGGGGRARPVHPLIELTLARLREFWREPEAVFWTFVFPVLLAWALGIAFRNTAPERVPVAVEASHAAAARLAESLAAAPQLNVRLLPPEEATRALRTGKVDVVVRAGGGAPDGQAPAIDYRFDPTRPESQSARATVDDALQRSFGRRDPAVTRDEVFSEPGARYIDFLIPGLIGLNLMGSSMWGLGFAVVQARSRKLLKRFAATPMRRSHYLLSFMLSRLVFLAFEVGAIVGFAWIVFDVAVHGSLAALVVIALVGAFTFSGLGMLVAARPRTIEGVSGWMNLVMVPMWLFSGTFFSASRFPDVVQPFIKALPLTALNEAMRAVINEGAPFASTWLQLLILAAWALASFTVATRIFRWQ